MDSAITKRDVVLYFSGELDTERRREIEAAWQTDPRVKGWFSDLTPTVQELESEPLPSLVFDPHDTAMREVFAAEYFATQQEGWMNDLAHWFRTVAGTAGRIGDFMVDFGQEQLAAFRNGALAVLYPAPRTAYGDKSIRAMQRVEVPLIRADYASGRLTVRQWAESAPSGTMQVFAAKRLEGGQVRAFGPVYFQMNSGAKDGKTYWYADISLTELIGDFAPGDEFFYYAEPVLAHAGNADSADLEGTTDA